MATPEALYSQVSARDTADLIRPGMARVDYIVAGPAELRAAGGRVPGFEPVFRDRESVVLRRHRASR